MYTVAQVLRPEFGRSWHEAVAIVQAAGSQLDPGVALPGAEDLLLDESGTLSFGFGSESTDDPVVALSGLLTNLLEGVEAPPSLLDFAIENGRPSQAPKTVSAFGQALAFFERPNRANDIRAVVGRLRSFRQKSPLDEEFDRLREKVATAEAEKPKPERRKPRLSRRDQAIVIAALVVLVFGTLAYQSGAYRSMGMVVGGVDGGIQRVISAALDVLGNSKASSAVAAAQPAEQPKSEPVETAAPKPAARPPAVRTAASAVKVARSSAPVAGTSGSGPVRRSVSTPIPGRSLGIAVNASPPKGVSEPARPTPATVLPQLEASPVVRGATQQLLPPIVPAEVYSNTDPEVQAPALVRPQLPREPAPGSDTGYFDLIVDESGNVAQVKLVSPRRLYHDRMLVAAAKAWKFRPAMLNGQPVKYRIRVPIILTGMPGS
jgi:protein TonB